MNERIRGLYDEAGAALAEAKALLGQYEGKEMPQEVATQFDRLMDQVDGKQAEARRLEGLLGRERALREIDEQKRLDAPLRAQGRGGPQLSPEAKAFEIYLRMGESAPGEVKAALNIGTDAQGGYLTPTEYSNAVVRELYELSVLRQAGARIIPLSSDSMKAPTITATSAAVLTSEASAFDEKEPTFGETTFTPYKYTRLAKASDEMVSDSRFPLWDAILKPDFVQAFAAAENTAFTTGTGSSQPEGVVTGATVGVTLANGTSQVSTIASADSLIDLYHALDHKYRARAKWMLNDATLKIIRKFQDANDQYIWQPGLAAGQPDTILGRPVVINPSMATPAANAKTILFGDFSYFWIGDREGLQIKVLQELYAGSGQVGFRAYKRFDSHVMLAGAIQALKQAAS